MYGVMYAISPEIFPAKDRGTGNGLTSTAARVFGVLVRFSLASRAARSYCSPTLRPPSLRYMQTLLRRCLCISLER